MQFGDLAMSSIEPSYCRRWNFLHSRPIDPCTEEEARRRDTAGESYSAVIGDPAAPDRIIEVARPNCIGVWFFDPRQRQSLHYVFRRSDASSLFLGEMIRWEYPNDAALLLNQASKIETLRFGPDGVVHHETRDRIAQERRRVSYRNVNVACHFEPIPAFGDWASIARWERDTQNQSR